MPWSGGTYTKWNNSSGGWAGDQAAGVGIESGRHDSQDNDFTTGINSCLAKDGQNSATADLPMGGFKHTGVANGTARNNYAAVGQVQDSSFLWGGTSGGSANAQTLTLTPAITAYTAGQRFRFIAGFTPTAAVTLNINSVGAKNIIADQIGQQMGNLGFYKGQLVEVVYDGTDFRQVQGSNLLLANFNAGNTSRGIQFYKSRGAEYPTNTIVTSGDTVGIINFWGATGTTYDRAAYIAGEVDGTPGSTSDMPGRLIFGTTPDGSGTTAERMRITNAGRVGINTTSPGGIIHITNGESASVNTLVITNSVAGDVSTAGLTITKKDNNSTTSQVIAQFLTNAGANGQGQINANGALQAAFGSYSDERLKENIVPLPSQLANIMALQPVEFDYKSGAGHQIGFIAQEVEAIYPDLIGIGADGYLTLSGLGKNEARMIKAFQEFAQQVQAKFTALEARIAELEK